MSQLLTYKTDLKSLRFGHDRPDGGSSNQPYIKTPIPPQDMDRSEALTILGTPIGTGTDAILRGGISSGENIADDLLRMGKYFTDIKTPRGLQFITNQGILSNISVKTQASSQFSPNQGFYSPLQTLAQIGINNIGGHTNRFLKNILNPLKGVTTYAEALSKPRKNDYIEGPINNDFTVDLNSSITIEKQPIAGVSSPAPLTKIGMFEHNNRLVQLAQTKVGLYSTNPKNGYMSVVKPSSTPTSYQTINSISPDPLQILRYFGGPTEGSILGLTGDTQIKIATDSTNKTPLRTGIENPEIAKVVGNITNQNFNKKNDGLNPEEFTDFRVPKIGTDKSSLIMGIAPSYNPTDDQTIDGPEGSRINMKSPGRRGNILNYVEGKKDLVTNEPVGAVDMLNALPIYQSKWATSNKIKNDLVKFRIAAINTSNPSLLQYMHFRAFIDKFDDSYQGNWSAVSYMGRGEDFHRYSKFTRSISIGYTILAQSKPEIMEQYKKLNFLVSNTAPDYTSYGYMAGPLMQLTMGGWCYELPGFINNINISIPQESPWEIAIPIKDSKAGIADGITFEDNSVKEMPHMVKVDMTYTPIHRFRPQKQINEFTPSDLKARNDEKVSPQNRQGKVGVYGPQRYIQLADGLSTKYNNYDNPTGIIEE